MGNHTPTATYERLPGQFITFRSPYSAGWVTTCKGVPRDLRAYDPDDGHAWTIAPPCAEMALQAFRRFFPDASEVHETARRSQAPSRNRSADDAFTVLYLLPTAPAPVVNASYRALAKLHHPDHGGDAAKMRAITEARDAIVERLGA